MHFQWGTQARQIASSCSFAKSTTLPYFDPNVVREHKTQTCSAETQVCLVTESPTNSRGLPWSAARAAATKSSDAGTSLWLRLLTVCCVSMVNSRLKKLARSCRSSLKKVS